MRNLFQPNPLTAANTQADLPAQATKATRLFVVLFSTTAIVTVGVFWFYSQIKVEALYAAGWIIFVLALATLVATLLSQRNRITVGASIALGAHYLLLPVLSIFISGLGILLSLILTLITIATASHTLKGKKHVISLITGYLAMLAILTIDFFATWPRFQPPSQFYLFLWIVALILGVVYFRLIDIRLASLNLQTKLIVGSIITALIPLAILSTFNFSSASNILSREVDEQLEIQAEHTAERLDNFVETNLAIVHMQAHLPDFKAFLGRKSTDNVDNWQQGNLVYVQRNVPQIFETFPKSTMPYAEFIVAHELIGDDGQVLISTEAKGDLGNDRSQALQKPFLPLPTEPTVYIKAVDSEILGEPTIHNLFFVSPILDDTEAVIGAFQIRYNAAVLQRIIASESGNIAEGQSVAILVDENLVRLADAAVPEFNFLPIQNLTEFTDALLKTDTAPNRFVGAAHPNADLEQGAIARMETAGRWYVVFVQPRQAFLNEVNTLTKLYVLFGVLMVGLAALAAVIVSRYLTRPLLQLGRVARQVAAGDLTIRATVPTQDEVGFLANAINSMTAQLQSLIGSLEEQVKARTADLTRSIEVGQRIINIREIEQLLPSIVIFVQEEFKLYAVQLYLVDDLQHNLVFRAGVADYGRRRIEREHRVPFNATGNAMVSQAAITREIIVIPNRRRHSEANVDLLLPDIESELAIPLISNGQVMGVLLMHSDVVNTFQANNVSVFEAMATQLAASINGAQQWTAGQEASQRAETFLRKDSLEGWRTQLALSDAELSYSYNLTEISPGAVIGENHRAIPLRVQNNLLGHIALETEPNQPWGDAEQMIVDSVAQHLAQKAETLRLFNQTQRLANRERITREIVDKIRESRDVESALKTAAQELNKALGTVRAVASLNVVDNDDSDMMLEANGGENPQ